MKSKKVLKAVAAVGLLATMAVPVMAASDPVELNLKNGVIVNEKMPVLRRSSKHASFLAPKADQKTIDACIDQLFEYYEEDIVFNVDYTKGTIEITKQYNND